MVEFCEEEDEALRLPAESWFAALSFLDTPDVCRFACAHGGFYDLAQGYAGPDFGQHDWLRERRAVVQERWSRARAVLVKVQVVQSMRAVSSSANARRCSHLQRLNRHRR
mmetsp:Transcript_176798/g.567075  ORF Transcript_176798/g.567075 Transcript_176798/m.567075 type:complete len:110 (-) Transcript_176798:47-376(-)